MKNHNNCCGNIFEDFIFKDIRKATPPEEKGLYAIRINIRGSPASEIILNSKKFLDHLNWGMVNNYLLNRISRIENIGDCPTIYIGSAGTYENSKNHLKGRYNEFSGRHTSMYPLWVLLAHGWELEYGWKISHNPKIDEKDIKKKYMELHNDKLPSLVRR